VALKIAHITELNFVLFPLLSVVMQLVDELKRKVEASRKDAVRRRKGLLKDKVNDYIWSFILDKSSKVF